MFCESKWSLTCKETAPVSLKAVWEQTCFKLANLKQLEKFIQQPIFFN